MFVNFNAKLRVPVIKTGKKIVALKVKVLLGVVWYQGEKGDEERREGKIGLRKGFLIKKTWFS